MGKEQWRREQWEKNNGKVSSLGEQWGKNNEGMRTMGKEQWKSVRFRENNGRIRTMVLLNYLGRSEY
jgi:hypothetical protein